MDQSRQIEQLSELVSDLRDENEALQQCLEDAGIIRRQRVQGRKANNQFVRRARTQGWTFDGHCADIFSVAEFTSLILSYEPSAARSVRPAERFQYRNLLPKLCVCNGIGRGGKALRSAECLDLTGHWEIMTSPWGARGVYSASASCLAGKLYLFGGRPNNGILVRCWEPRERRWRHMRSMKSPCYHHASAAVGERIYVCGGECRGQATSAVQRFDPDDGPKGAWEEVNEMRENRCNFVAASVAGQLFVCGGVEPGRHYLEPVTTSECLDPSTYRWTEAAPMLVHRWSHGGAVVAGKLYVCGGQTRNHGGAPTPVGFAERYDFATDTWEWLPPMSLPRFGAATVCIGGSLYVLGGAVSLIADPLGLSSPNYPDEDRLDWMERFDPETNTWEWAAEPRMIGPRAYFCAGVLG